jgi:hypothetical protein
VEGTSANWRKSSYSGANGGNCVEVGTAPWRKSSHSGSNGGACVEVGTTAHRVGSGVLIRDTTDRSGPVLSVGPAAWRALTGAIRGGHAIFRS